MQRSWWLWALAEGDPEAPKEAVLGVQFPPCNPNNTMKTTANRRPLTCGTLCLTCSITDAQQVLSSRACIFLFLYTCFMKGEVGKKAHPVQTDTQRVRGTA